MHATFGILQAGRAAALLKAATLRCDVQSALSSSLVQLGRSPRRYMAPRGRARSGWRRGEAFLNLCQDLPEIQRHHSTFGDKITLSFVVSLPVCSTVRMSRVLSARLVESGERAGACGSLGLPWVRKAIVVDLAGDSQGFLGGDYSCSFCFLYFLTRGLDRLVSHGS